MTETNKKTSGFIPLPKSTDPSQLVKKIDLDHLKEQNNFTKWLMVGVIIVLFIGLVGFIIDSFVRSGQAYSDYRQTVEEYRKEYSEIKIKLFELENKITQSPNTSTVSSNKK